MNIIETGAEMLVAELGLPVQVKTVVAALSSLLGDGEGDLNLADLAARMAENTELTDVLGSWLDDGGNSPISAGSLLSLLGKSEIADFAAKIGTDSDTAARGLADVIPQMMDEGSSGGSLLNAVGGIGGLMGSAKSFLT